mgnify:CR=1 FL=1
MEILANFINLFVAAMNLLILARVLMSWVVRDPYENPVTKFIYEATEPVLEPVRRVLPKMGMIDLSPLVTLLLLNFLADLIKGYLI